MYLFVSNQALPHSHKAIAAKIASKTITSHLMTVMELNSAHSLAPTQDVETTEITFGKATSIANGEGTTIKTVDKTKTKTIGVHLSLRDHRMVRVNLRMHTVKRRQMTSVPLS